MEARRWKIETKINICCNYLLLKVHLHKASFYNTVVSIVFDVSSPTVSREVLLHSKTPNFAMERNATCATVPKR